MNYNELIEEPNHAYLNELFSKVMEEPLKVDPSNGSAILKVKISHIDVAQPQHPFDFCYKYGISYAYTVDITCNVIDVTTDEIVHTQVLQVNFPKYYQNGFFFRTSKYSEPKFRTPIIKAVSSTSASVYDDVITLKLLDGSTAFFYNAGSSDMTVSNYSLGLYNDTITEEDFDDLILHPTAVLKLSHVLGKPVSNYLSFQFLKELYDFVSTSDGAKALKTFYAIDYKFNQFEDSLMIAARSYAYKCKSLRRLLWTKYNKLYASTLQGFINKSFSTGGNLGVITDRKSVV